MEDDSYMPPSEDEVSLGDDEFGVLEDPIQQERFKRRLIATARSLKKKQRQLQAEQDLLVDRWTDVLTAEKYGLKRTAKRYPKRRLLPQFDEEAIDPIPPSHNADQPPHGRDKRQLRPNSSPPHRNTKTEIRQLGILHMTFDRTWTVEQDITDRSTNREDRL